MRSSLDFWQISPYPPTYSLYERKQSEDATNLPRNSSPHQIKDYGVGLLAALVDAMSDEDIDLSDCPEITPEMFAKAVVRRGLPGTKNKAQVTLRIDRDVLEWFKSQGRGYQTQINALLRAYMEAHK